VLQVGYLQRLYRDARSTEHKDNEMFVYETAYIVLLYVVVYEIWGSYSGKYEYYCILRRDAMYFGT
jgi:hypothetical protein